MTESYNEEITTIDNHLMDTIAIIHHLQEHLDYSLKQYNNPDWFGIFLVGSQNYGLADEQSDIDSKLLVLPKWEDICKNKTPVSHTIEFPDGSCCDVKDLREYFKVFRKQNINFVEILFTDYFIINPKYDFIWLQLKEHAEELAHMNRFRTVKCVQGTAHVKARKLKDFSTFNEKDYSTILRLYYFLLEYVRGTPYKKCIYLEPGIRKRILKKKRTKIHKDDWCNVCTDVDLWLACIDNIAVSYESVYPSTTTPTMERKPNEFLDAIIYMIMTKSTKEQLNKIQSF